MPADPHRPCTTAPIWASLPTERTVLLAVQNLTTLNRLLDVLPLFTGDHRVQCLVTSDLEDPFVDGLAEQLSALGLPTVPWWQATQMPFDLILSAGHHGRVTELTGPIVVMSHGIGFSKLSPGTAPDDPAGERPVYGVDRSWLLRDGRPAVTSLLFSHPTQLDRLAADVPEALPLAEIVGDPCYDRLLAAVPHRAELQEACGARGRRMVVISSTWSACGLLGAWPDLVERLVTELPAEEYQVVLVAHPNTWAWHGSLQLRLWLDRSLRAGLVLVPPEHGWHAELLAAELVVGDHGSVTTYAAALGTPVLLGAFPDGEVVPGSAAHLLGTLAERLDPDRSPGDQVRAAFDRAALDGEEDRYAAVRELVTSVPGESLLRLRTHFYRLMNLTPLPGELKSTPIAPSSTPALR